MYCKDCYYDLKGLGQGNTCPECGRVFYEGDVDSYWEVVPGYFRRKYWVNAEGRERLPSRLGWWCWVSLISVWVMLFMMWFFGERFFWISKDFEVLVLVGLLALYLVALVWGVCIWGLCVLNRVENLPSVRIFFFFFQFVIIVLALGRGNAGHGYYSSTQMNLYLELRYSYMYKTEDVCAGLPRSWERDDLLAWMQVNHDVGSDSEHEEAWFLKRLSGLSFKLISVDLKEVTYRFFGGNGVDDEGLRDDRDIVVDLRRFWGSHERNHGEACQFSEAEMLESVSGKRQRSEGEGE